MERPRRLSYAGVTNSKPQNSRRISDAGQMLTMHDSRYDSGVSSKRRVGRHSRDEGGFTCSQQSVLSAMERFVRAVDDMDSTVLVPSRLRDMEVSNENGRFSKCLPSDAADVYRFYTMLKDTKNELLWGPSLPPPLAPTIKHIRQPSDESIGLPSSSSDQETDGSDVESLATDRDSLESDPCTLPTSGHLAAAFRHHLLGLHTILHELADSADFLSNRYQEEIDGP